MSTVTKEKTHEQNERHEETERLWQQREREDIRRHLAESEESLKRDGGIPMEEVFGRLKAKMRRKYGL